MEDFEITIEFVNVEVIRGHHRSSAKRVVGWNV